MDPKLINSATHINMTQLLILALFFFTLCSSQELLRGFKATPNPSEATFQPLLTDSSGNYSLSFLRVNENQLAVAVVHVRSSEPLWTAAVTSPPPRWSGETELIFNGSLVLRDQRSGVFWSTHTNGDRVWLSNDSNLQIVKAGEDSVLLWQSFDFPSDTLVENQNFTSAMRLVSSNGLYSMRLGSDFIGLYSGSGQDQIYYKHRALQAKAEVKEGQGPIYLTLKSNGYLGLYQNGSGSGSVPVDVQSFNSYQLPISGRRRIRIQQNGNLIGYFWTGSSWTLDYQAIPDPCELPFSCGSYALCGSGRVCSCIDNSTAGKCSPENQDSGDFCKPLQSKFRVLRRNGVELPNKELFGYKKIESFSKCEGFCEQNCSCWGVVYSNNSGLCYTLDFPIGTLLSVEDESKMGYFKVREGVGEGKRRVVGPWVGFGVLCGAILVGGGVGAWWYRSRKGKSGYVEEEEVGNGVGPYKHLDSFRSIEMMSK